MSSRPHDQSRQSASVPPPQPPDELSTAGGRTRSRHRARPMSRALRRTRRARFASVWSVAETDPLPGTALLPGWLGRTLLTLVTGYTRPGHRVLLLTPPRRPRMTPTVTPGVITGWFGPNEFAGLAEASWTLARLGRSITTATAAPPPDYLDTAPPTVPSAPGSDRGESESGLRPTPVAPRRRPAPDRPARHGPHRDSETGGRSSHGFDLIITAVHPHATDWLSHTDWTSMLTPTGLVVVVTYSDSRASHAQDPMPALVATFRDIGLVWFDHIALLCDSATTTAATSGTTAVRRDSAAPNGTPLPVIRAHHDLLLFLPAAATAPNAHDDAAPASQSPEEEHLG
jgi:hypothetical protein